MKPNNFLFKFSLLKISRNLLTVNLLTICLLSIFLFPQHSFAAKLIVDCSKIFCKSAAQKNIVAGNETFRMFDKDNFLTIKDKLGRDREFWVHIPALYDKLADNQKMPLIFAFHGWGQTNEAMVDGKWGSDYFEKDIAFVIPLGAYSPCHSEDFGRVWLGPLLSTDPRIETKPECNPSTQILDGAGNKVTYFSANLTDTFTDVNFIEELRAMVLSRFPKLNANKVYATGFSLGGGMAYYLLCYRSSLFRGFSIVSATLLNGDQQRGDHDGDLTIQTTDPNSLVATCGKTQWDAGHATGIIKPDLWGYGITYKKSPNIPLPFGRSTKPVVLFAGDHDSFLSVQDIEQTTNEITSRNNLNPAAFFIKPFYDLNLDNAITEHRGYNLAEELLHPSDAFVRYKVTRTVNDPTDDPSGGPVFSAGHAMPDADEIKDRFIMTRDYNYTDETINFFETYADLNLNP